MKFHQLRAFVAVHRHGGIKAAARALDLTQAAVTKAIKELEREVGTALITRGARGTVLTDWGLRLAERGSVAMEQVDRVAGDLAQLRDGGGKLAFGTTATIGATILPDVVARFGMIMPRVALRLVSASGPEVLGDLRSGLLDFAVVATNADRWPEDLVYREMMEAPLVVIAGRGHPSARCTSIKDLAPYPWVFRGKTDRSFDTTTWGLELLDQPPPPVSVMCTPMATALRLVAEAGMLMTVPRFLAEHDYVRRQVVRVPIAESFPPIRFGVLRRADVPLSPAAELMIEILADAADALVAGRVTAGDYRRYSPRTTGTLP